MSSDYSACESFKEEFKSELQFRGLSMKQVYNADESALFFKLTPRSTLVCHDENSAAGRKIIKTRVTFMPCSNIDGSNKLPLTIIGTAARPRCFPKAEDRDIFLDKFDYYHSKKAWMTYNIFRSWFYTVFVKSVQSFADKMNITGKLM